MSSRDELDLAAQQLAFHEEAPEHRGTGETTRRESVSKERSEKEKDRERQESVQSKHRYRRGLEEEAEKEHHSMAPLKEPGRRGDEMKTQAREPPRSRQPDDGSLGPSQAPRRDEQVTTSIDDDDAVRLSTHVTPTCTRNIAVGAVAIPGPNNRDIETGDDGTVICGDPVVADPVVKDDLADKVREQVSAELHNDMQARMLTAERVTPNEAKLPFWSRRRLLGVTCLALLLIVSLAVGLLVKRAPEQPSDPNTIRGLSIGGRFGDFVIISRDGTTLAAGADEGSYVQTFRRKDKEWKQIGQNLYGDGQFGRTLDLNYNGRMLVVGSWNNGDAADKAGKAMVYQFNGTMWDQVGQKLLGDASLDRFGYYVSMSENGRRIAVSARNGDTAMDRFDAGYVRIFSYDGNIQQNTGKWSQIGQDLEGEAADEQFGKRLAISADGLRLAVSAVRWDESRGRVRVFDYSMGTWNETIQPLEGNSSGDKLGTSLALTPKGDILAVGADEMGTANGNMSGFVGVYKLHGNAWMQHGQAILGETENVRLGIGRVSLSDDGNCLAAGGSHHDDLRGIGYLHRWNETESQWSKAVEVIGDNPGDRLGGASALSGDCKWVAWGANQETSEYVDRTGYVRVYYAQDIAS